MPPQRSQLYNVGVGESSFLVVVVVDPTGNSSGSERFNSFSFRIDGDRTAEESEKVVQRSRQIIM